MTRKIKSQWEFGELFEAQATRRVLTVSELTGQVRRLLEKEFGRVWVSGEVSNLRHHPSGHSYFTLKDGQAQLNCVLFRGEARESRKYLEDGRKVLLEGDLTVYEPRGQYQLRVTAIELQGAGALQMALERLKQKLQAEGLFALERKRALPDYVQRLGLVTSPSGAAIRDVLHVVQRRNPGLEIVLVPCRVQGEGAAGEMVQAIRLLNRWSEQQAVPLDLILLTRGGGSLEDLWAFNEEILARAIVASRLPVVSAVGHEIDFTVSDLAADLRAATPSAAAEILTEGMMGARQFVVEAWRRMRQLARQQWRRQEEQAAQWARRLGRLHPRRVLEEKQQYLDELQMSLGRGARLTFRQHRAEGDSVFRRLARLKPSQFVAMRRQDLEGQRRRLGETMASGLTGANTELQGLADRLRLLSPDHVLARGYSITMIEQGGQVVRGPAEVRPGQALRTRLRDGTIRSVVEE